MKDVEEKKSCSLRDYRESSILRGESSLNLNKKIKEIEERFREEVWDQGLLLLPTHVSHKAPWKG